MSHADIHSARVESTLHKLRHETHLLQTFPLLLQSPDITVQFSTNTAHVHFSCLPSVVAVSKTLSGVSISSSRPSTIAFIHYRSFLHRGRSTQPLMQEITTFLWGFTKQEINFYQSANVHLWESWYQLLLVQQRVKEPTDSKSFNVSLCIFSFY